MPTQQPPAETYDDEIDLRQLVTTLWRQKGLIVGMGVLGAALGLGASALSTKYVADGLFLTPGMPAPLDSDGEDSQRTTATALSAADYKRYETVLSNGVRLQQYLRATKQDSTAEGQLLIALAATPGELSETLKPEFAFTDRDQKSLGVKLNGDDSGAMVGVRIQFAHKEPTGGTPVTLLAEYVRDSIIRVNMEGTMLSHCNEFSTREQELRNKQIENDFAIRQEERRLGNLRDIIARNPDASAIDNRQIVSLEKGTERFLSPAAQLVASEIQIADLKLADNRRERQLTASALKRDYYCQAQQALQQAITGKTFLIELKNIQAAVFQGQDKSVDVVEQTWNELDLQRETWSNTYLSGMRFVASPEGTEVTQRKPGLALGGILGGLLGGMLGVMVALVRGWWRNSAAQSDNATKA